MDRDGGNSVNVTVTQSVCDKNVTPTPVLPADSSPSWIVIAVVLTASVCVACLLLPGCFALLWYAYKKTKYTFCPRNSLPQHLKEVGGGGARVGWEP